ncbi:MAG: hypothetical protein ACFCBU_06135 [Cyanophyceae cyanobacterium]
MAKLKLQNREEKLGQFNNNSSMADSILGLKNKLRGLSVETQAIAQKLHSADRDYLALLGKTARQQLILACYQVCTTQYPEAFLTLTVEQKQTLQTKVKALGLKLQQNIVDVLDSVLDKQPRDPDTFQEFIISSLFSNARISRKRRRYRKGKSGIGSDLDNSGFDSDDDLGENNRTLVVLSNEISSEELSETGLSPDRLAEALANALESVMAEDEDDSDDDDLNDRDIKELETGQGEDEAVENIEKIADENVENDADQLEEITDSADRKTVNDATVSLGGLPSEGDGDDREETAANSEDAGEDLKDLAEADPVNGERADDGDLGRDRDNNQQDDNQQLENSSSGSDTSSSFLGEYFANGAGRSAGEGENGIKNGTDGRETPSIEGETQPLVIQSKLDTAGGLSTLGLAGSTSSLSDNSTAPIDITKSDSPQDVIQWQRSRERLVLSKLQKFSYRTNQLLRTSKAIPEPLANPFIDGDLSLSRESSSKTPNLLSLTIAPTKAPAFGGRPAPMRMVAVHLNLGDLELVNPDLRRRSLKIRKLFSQLETLNQQHQDTQKKLNIAQADLQWRSSWSDDT